MKKLLLLLWQLPQYLVGVLVLFWNKIFLKEKYLNTYYVKCNDHKNVIAKLFLYRNNGKGKYKGVSFGKHIFIYYDDNYKDMKKMNDLIKNVVIPHEYGHSIQSVYLGWLYLIIIGLPSLLFSNIGGSAYRNFYTELWAEKLIKNKIISTSNKCNLVVTL
jgi:hypothetical protein